MWLLPALPFLDLIFLNEFEAAQALSVKIRQGEQDRCSDAPEVCRDSFGSGSPSLGDHPFSGRCACTSRDGQQLFQPSLQVPPNQIAGAVGAGDAFAAGLLLGYHDGLADGGLPGLWRLRRSRIAPPSEYVRKCGKHRACLALDDSARVNLVIAQIAP